MMRVLVVAVEQVHLFGNNQNTQCYNVNKHEIYRYIQLRVWIILSVYSKSRMVNM